MTSFTRFPAVAAAISAAVAISAIQLSAGPAIAQVASPQDAPAPAAECPKTGLNVTSRVSGDIPLGGPIVLSSRHELDRDVKMEESIASRLATLGFELDDNAFWQLSYETDSSSPVDDPRFTINSEVQGGKEPEAIGRYRFDRTPDGCGPLSTYTIDFEILDDGARVVWRGHAANITATKSPVVEKERMVERLVNALRSDLRDAHNMSGR